MDFSDLELSLELGDQSGFEREFCFPHLLETALIDEEVKILSEFCE